MGAGQPRVLPFGFAFLPDPGSGTTTEPPPGPEVPLAARKGRRTLPASSWAIRSSVRPIIFAEEIPRASARTQRVVIEGEFWPRSMRET